MEFAERGGGGGMMGKAMDWLGCVKKNILIVKAKI